MPFDATPYCSTIATDEAFPVLSEIVACLQSLNIAVEQVLKYYSFYVFVLDIFSIVFV